MFLLGCLMCKEEFFSLLTSLICFTSCFGSSWGRQSTGSKIERVLRMLLTPIFYFPLQVFLIHFGQQFFYRCPVHVVPDIHICGIEAPVCNRRWSLPWKKFTFHKLFKVSFHFINSFNTFTNKLFNLVYKPFVNWLQKTTNLICWKRRKKIVLITIQIYNLICIINNNTEWSMIRTRLSQYCGIVVTEPE